MKKTVDPTLVRKILFITLSNIGDVILTTPSLDLVRRFFRKAAITVLVGPRAREVLEDHPQIDRLILYDKHAPFKSKLALMMQLREERFDLVVDLRHTLIPLLIRPRFATPLVRSRSGGHAALRHLAPLKSIGIIGPADFVLPDRPWDRERVQALLNGTGLSGLPFAVMGPGAANRLKRWDLPRFRELAGRLRETQKLEIVIVGPKEDEAEFAAAFPPGEWPNLTGRLTLAELTQVLRRARLFITNDSGPMHLAHAVKTPVLAIFGPTDEKLYGPLGPNHRVVRVNLQCTPCMAGFCKIKTRDCLENLSVDTVYKTAVEMLGLQLPTQGQG